jgi:ribosome-associated protein
MKRRVEEPDDPDEPEDLTSRTDKKRANRVVEETLSRLVDDLCGLGSKQLTALDLPEAVLDTVRDAQAIKSIPARKRQLRLVRGALRVVEWSVIRERVSELMEHGRLSSGPASRGDSAGLEAVWIARLLGEGFVGLDAFLTEFPRADRVRLKDLIKQVDRSSHERRVRAERKLADAIRGFLRARPTTTL